MLYRKIARDIESHLKSASDKIMLIEGARQVGKSYIVRHVGERLFRNFIEINLVEDKEGPQMFAGVHTVEDFYLMLSARQGDKMGTREDTLIFLDEIQEYPHLITLLKFLRSDNRYGYIASGSLLGVTLRQTTSIPIGSIVIKDMYPLDFEEFAIANGVGEFVFDHMRKSFDANKPLSQELHERILGLFKKYLLIGGMPDAVNEYLASNNIMRVRDIQRSIIRLYGADASKYDVAHRLNIQRIYQLIPSNMENKKKRMVIKDINDKKNDRYTNYADDFEYLVDSGIALETKAVSNPKFPLIESAGKNLFKLYLNDVGLLSCLLFSGNVQAVLGDVPGINLGSLYETLVAQELKAHGHILYYYDNKTKGEVDFLVDDYERLTTLPIEVKSGHDYSIHAALTRFVGNRDYGIDRAIVLCNARDTCREGKILYLPIYYVAFV